ncbi:hypothetical protein [Micromonospora sp. NPDC049175]|uniref:hypothetical protein n=1 Tax=unclassified Micromonospora TaxID=2617518 RepID=UPI003714ACCE
MELRKMIPKIEMQVGDPLAGRLLFRAQEHSFSYEVTDGEDFRRRSGDEGLTSLVADTLQLEVGIETGELLFAWGYFPATSWSAATLPRPNVVPGVLRLVSVDELEAGVSLSIFRGGDWKAEFDQAAGFLRVSLDDGATASVVEIAQGVAVGVRDGLIRSVWLRPLFVH